MSVGRDVIADVAKVPESHVRCSTCISYNAEYDYCEGWEQSAKPSDFCSFWVDEEKHSYWGLRNPVRSERRQRMRAINTDVLIEKYGDWYVEDWTGERFIGNMRAFVYDVVPTVDVVEAPRWISVTEKLPEIDWTFSSFGTVSRSV